MRSRAAIILSLEQETKTFLMFRHKIKTGSRVGKVLNPHNPVSTDISNLGKHTAPDKLGPYPCASVTGHLKK